MPILNERTVPNFEGTVPILKGQCLFWTTSFSSLVRHSTNNSLGKQVRTCQEQRWRLPTDQQTVQCGELTALDHVRMINAF